MKIILNLSFTLFFVFSAYAQNAQNAQNAQKNSSISTIQERPLSLQKEFYIKGDAIAIGNNILSEQVKKDYNEIGLINDRIEMKYVDIDNESSTFSSSSAALQLPHNTSKIKFAALYWSATYGFKKGDYKVVKNKMLIKAKGARDTTFNYIKFKTPNQEYKNIKGEIIFDGYEKKFFAANSPYVCYADVTSILQNTNTNGYYTVANIRATEGVITGGSSAGWVLYLVYEHEDAMPKYISTYHGLSLLNKQPLAINFNNFKTTEFGEIDASITMAAIEGDAKLKTDKFSVFSKKENTFVDMSSTLRPAQNFFNSKITSNKDYVTTRFPKSKNTLGFDLISFNIPNTNHTFLENNQTNLDVKVHTKADRFYMFFTAFKTDISEACFIENNIKNNDFIVSLDILKEAKPVVGNIDDEE
ncbi:hypothetical protein KO494_00655 [Lacinutrix sp. C3R15]|uniref:hypothetical protein n=1 Tax=Flavobacteriaceae TaxID=49546 RepID=UPI001C0815E9|nr:MULTISPECIES: hypothetical protein [Flavobacteriaceae]MBU2938035.1 hypothetical protein [Lacinutrix sp. C3R15]MDO6621349.1 hypothetical protein [Oceanihabitans sp. 1_MG-2023]